MGEQTMYGRCGLCNRWVPRDEMLSVHVDFYDEDNKREVIRQRLCPPCWRAEKDRVRETRWDRLVVNKDALEPMEDGSLPTKGVVQERWDYLRGLGADVPAERAVAERADGNVVEVTIPED